MSVKVSGITGLVPKGSDMGLDIGQWVKRPELRKWHRVESVVAGDAVTKCGRRLSDEAGLDKRHEAQVTDTDKCRNCG